MVFLIIFRAIFYFLPAYLANAVPVLLARWNLFGFLAVPVDFGREWMGEDLFGRTKTWRGILGGVAAALTVIFFQFLLYENFPQTAWWFITDYKFPEVLWLGLAMGLGEGLGDLLKSFFKRRLHLKSSSPFFPFDQLSFLGALLLSLFFYIPDYSYILSIIIISPLLPVIANIAAFRIGWKKVWW